MRNKEKTRLDIAVDKDVITITSNFDKPSVMRLDTSTLNLLDYICNDNKKYIIQRHDMREVRKPKLSCQVG